MDFDLETAPGTSAPFRAGALISWAVDATRAAREISGINCIISHAPQPPCLGDWAGAHKGYMHIMRQAGAAIDFLNVQYWTVGYSATMARAHMHTFICPVNRGLPSLGDLCREFIVQDHRHYLRLVQ